MPPTIAIPLDVPDVRVLSATMNAAGDWVITVDSTLTETTCRQCRRVITTRHGHDDWVTLRHVPILGARVFLRLRPQRYRCPDCTDRPTTTQQLDWYAPKSPHTTAYDRSLLVHLITSTIEDVSAKERVGGGAVLGAIDRCLGATVDWAQVSVIKTLGLDEIALKKGHRNFVVIVSARPGDGRTIILAVLPDRTKETVTQFLSTIPLAVRATIKTVCTDLYDGYINAAKDVLPEARVVIDRFHVAKVYRDAADTVRKVEIKRLKKELPAEETEHCKGLLWVFRKNRRDLDAGEADTLDRVLEQSPALQQTYGLREALTAIFEEDLTKAAAMERISAWQEQVRASGLTCFDRFLGTLDRWIDEITNYFVDRQSSGFVEGLNTKIKVIKRRWYGIFNVTHLFQRICLDVEGYRRFGRPRPATH